MSTLLDGLQFPIKEANAKPSTSRTGREIIAAALGKVSPQASQNALKEKNWRKNYPKYFKALVEYGIENTQSPISIAENGLEKAHQTFEFFKNGQKYPFSEVMQLDTQTLHTFKIQGQSKSEPEWYVPYQGKNLKGQDLLDQIKTWETKGIVEPSHANALREAVAHPEWFDLSDRTMVLFGAASEAGPLTWLSKWRANIVAVDLQNERVWNKILNIVEQGNATLFAPSSESLNPATSTQILSQKLGTNLLTQTADIAQWLVQNPNNLDLAAIAYLDGEKHVRVSMAMDAIMKYLSEHKTNTSLMYMCTPTDVYAIPQEVVDAAASKFNDRSTLEKVLSKGVSSISLKRLFQENPKQVLVSNNGQKYGIADCLVIEQGPNYALAKRIQQWRATLARHAGQRVSINIAPSTTTYSVTKNPLLKAAFNGASLFDVEAFEPATTNALMAALWIYDLRCPQSVANPELTLEHPLELMMKGANHGGLWRVAYLARTALPFAAVYGFATDKLPKALFKKSSK